MNFKNYTLIDWVTAFGIAASLLVAMMYLSGCALHAKVYTKNNEVCCERLDTRLDEMEEFNRYCMMMVFADRNEKDPKVQEDIKRRIGLCKFVFGVAEEDDLLSRLKHPEKEYYKVRSKMVPLRSGAWYPPMGCDPGEDMGCEEF